MTAAAALPAAVVALPVLTAAAVVAWGPRERARDLTLIGGAIATLVLVVWTWIAVRGGDILEVTAPFEVLPGVRLGLRADAFGTTFAALAAVLWVPASVYAITYLREHDESARTRFLAWYALCLSATFGVAFAADLVTFLVCYELLTIATYPLVIHTGTDEARAAGRRYLVYLLGGGAALVLGTAVVIEVVGQVGFVPGGFVGTDVAAPTVGLIGGLFALAFATKSAVMPLHAWLPAAMVAPTPVSALLHAVAVVKAGVFGFGRLTGFVLDPGALAAAGLATALAVITAVTIVAASVLAIRSEHLKRRLAYSTIAHLSFIVLGFALVDPVATEGAVLHLVNHGAAKITLFLVAGAVMVHAGIDRVSQLDGIGRRMPWTMAAFAVGGLSLVGLPPFGGLWSKLSLIRGAFAADQAWAGGVMALGGVLTAAYLLPIVHRAFFRPDSVQVAGLPRGDAHPSLVVPLCVTAALVVVLGVGDLVGLQATVADVAAGVFGGAP